MDPWGVGERVNHVVAYPQPDKRKALDVCEAFVSGVRASGGTAEVCLKTPVALKDGDAFFYGVRPFNEHLWRQCKMEGRTWWYSDNSYFDAARERQFRVTRGSIQHNGSGKTDGDRFSALGVQIRSRGAGTIVLACAQSDEFMKIVAREPDWLPRQVEMQRAAGHQVLVRHKGEKRPLVEDLARARLLVTWSSAAAVASVLVGVPVRCSPQCCAYMVDMADRERWAGVLADNQWTLEELARGMPMRIWTTEESGCQA